ncbi:hypothetical protein [Allomesorhizobium alhagi]|jgi:hypothetical protein|nr:hypothetical protein [Mesorhizobium alhagi]
MYMYEQRRTMMRKIALTMAAVLALSGTAFANDFAATLHYPESPRSAPHPTSKALDRDVTHSIKRETPRKFAPRLGDNPADATKSRRSGIATDPWVVPNFR